MMSSYLRVLLLFFCFYSFFLDFLLKLFPDLGYRSLILFFTLLC